MQDKYIVMEREWHARELKEYRDRERRGLSYYRNKTMHGLQKENDLFIDQEIRMVFKKEKNLFRSREGVDKVVIPSAWRLVLLVFNREKAKVLGTGKGNLTKESFQNSP